MVEMGGKIPVCVLGATGMVGQRFIQLLDNHPWFEVTALAASERSAGKTYTEAVKGRWIVSEAIPEYAKDMKVVECRASEIDGKVAFGALDSGVAEQIEKEFAEAGFAVVSNSKNHRMEKDVPLLIPEVNAEHLEAVEVQKKNRDWEGFIVTNPNCTTIQFVLALAPLHQKFGVNKIFLTSMQALSGAGYPGVASLNIIDNVVPYIGGEEEKVESEPLKLFGEWNGKEFLNAEIAITAQCNRVNVKDGHLETLNIKLDKKGSLDDVKKAMKEFNPLKELNLPSSPSHPIIVTDEENRPQPRMDRDLENGMASVVGRVRECPVLDYKFIVLGHNTVRGAAGAAILNAELLKAKSLI